MWIFTTDGFYSAVQHRDDPDVVLVRGRTRLDLERFVSRIQSMASTTPMIVETPNADYRYRVRVPRGLFARYLEAYAADALDYDDFKEAVAARHSGERAYLYHRISSILYTLQRRARPGIHVD